MTDAADRDLLVVGAGGVGSRVGAGWLAQHPGARVVAETRSCRSHAALQRAGLIVRLRSEPLTERFPRVLVCIPPSQQDDYLQECKRAASLWDGSGALVLVSSTAVYANADGGRCVEDSPLADNDRAGRLLAAEAIARELGGSIVRLAGLYDADRGPHRVFLRRDSVARRPDGLINLVHYDDAATLCLRALEQGRRGATYLGCDDQPLTRRQLLEATVRSGRYRSDGEPDLGTFFTATEGPLGRRCDSSATRDELGWRPRYRSFVEWIGEG